MNKGLVHLQHRDRKAGIFIQSLFILQVSLSWKHLQLFLWSSKTPIFTALYPQSQHLTLVLRSSLHTFQVNDTLAVLQSKEWDWETKGKVTPARVITLGSVVVCSICPSKALSSTLVKKPNKMAILNLCQLLKRLRGQTYQGLLHVYTVWYPKTVPLHKHQR